MITVRSDAYSLVDRIRVPRMHWSAQLHHRESDTVCSHDHAGLRNTLVCSEDACRRLYSQAWATNCWPCKLLSSIRSICCWLPSLFEHHAISGATQPIPYAWPTPQKTRHTSKRILASSFLLQCIQGSLSYHPTRCADAFTMIVVCSTQRRYKISPQVHWFQPQSQTPMAKNVGYQESSQYHICWRPQQCWTSHLWDRKWCQQIWQTGPAHTRLAISALRICKPVDLRSQISAVTMTSINADSRFSASKSDNTIVLAAEWTIAKGKLLVSLLDGWRQLQIHSSLPVITWCSAQHMHVLHSHPAA